VRFPAQCAVRLLNQHSARSVLARYFFRFAQGIVAGGGATAARYSRRGANRMAQQYAIRVSMAVPTAQRPAHG